jgi:hypothetical protein
MKLYHSPKDSYAGTHTHTHTYIHFYIDRFLYPIVHLTVYWIIGIKIKCVSEYVCEEEVFVC